MSDLPTRRQAVLNICRILQGGPHPTPAQAADLSRWLTAASLATPDADYITACDALQLLLQGSAAANPTAWLKLLRDGAEQLQQAVEAVAANPLDDGPIPGLSHLGGNPLLESLYGTSLFPLSLTPRGFLGAPTFPLASTCVTPPVYLTSWTEIVKVLGLKSNQADQRKVRRLHALHPGPMRLGGPGRQPFVEKKALLEWWSSLERRHSEVEERVASKKESTSTRHPYGADGEVVPEIKGHVKRRRKGRRK